MAELNLAYTVIAAAIVAAVAWGKTQADVSNLKRSVQRIEDHLFKP